MEEPSLGINYSIEVTTRFGFQIPKLIDDPRFPVDTRTIWNVAMPVMHKLAATEYHLKNYERIEYERIKVFEHQKQISRTEELDLIFELEAFLVQVKSSLDMLVKVMDPVLGKGRVRTQTFGDCGNNLLKGLEKYKSQKGVDASRIDSVIGLVQFAQSEWLREAISVRDEINHYRGLAYHYLEWDPTSKTVMKSQIRGKSALEFMHRIWIKNLEFQQDFICHVFAIAMPPPATLSRFNGESKVPNIRWSWEG